MSLAARASLFLAALFVEKFLLNFFVNSALAETARRAGAVIRVAQHFAFRFATPFVFFLLLFVVVLSDTVLARINSEMRTLGLRWKWVAVHVLLLTGVAASLTKWYGHTGIRLPIVATSVIVALAAVAALLTALAPLALWRRSAAMLRIYWLYAAGAAIIASAAFSWSQTFWGATAQITFRLVHLLLLPFLPGVHADPAARTLTANHFAIYVAPYCSGLEGMALMLAFSTAWLLCFRAEYRMPRALLIIPAGLLMIFGLNAVRIAALMVIGNSGYPGIALYGFHSQAGWIAFTGAACVLAWGSRRIRWLTHAPAAVETQESAANPTAAYLMPFLAMVAAGMLARAVSSGFETLYALRLIAATGCILMYRRGLSGLDWRFTWRGMAAGLVAFAVWLPISVLIVKPHGMPGALVAMDPAARDLWITARAATAILAAPLAEELAYRGYLLRRLVSPDFEEVSFRSVGWKPLLVTAVLFGALHGALWLPGTAAGIVYGWIVARTGRLGEAAVAHVTTNFLLCICVLTAGQWQLW